jgi:hypothetical protein
MRSTEGDRGRRERTVLAVLAGLLVLVVGAVAYHYWSRPPQMGASAEAFDTVDALYTAVRSRDEKAVGACERRLHSYRDTGALPADAAASLDGVIRQTRSGSWDAAARQLYGFMLAQRREGADEPRRPEPRAKKSK